MWAASSPSTYPQSDSFPLRLMSATTATRLKWIKSYAELRNAGAVCRRFGISRPTLRKWLRRYQVNGEGGLIDLSRRPRRLARQKVSAEHEAVVLLLRKERSLGVKQQRSELIRLHDLVLSVDTLHRILVRHGKQHLTRRRVKRSAARRYSRPIPGDRVQLDVCKIAPGVYQFTAVDDCSRYRVLGVYPRRTAKHTLAFLNRVVEEMPFAIERIQTDRGREFFAESVQQQLMDWAIKFRPIRPRAPHLNGKVERSQRADLEEFWPTVDIKAADLSERLDQWQHFWNWHRPHTALGGRSPIDRVCELIDKTPTYAEVEARFDSTKERIRDPNYTVDNAIAALK